MAAGQRTLLGCAAYRWSYAEAVYINEKITGVHFIRMCVCRCWLWLLYQISSHIIAATMSLNFVTCGLYVCASI